MPASCICAFPGASRGSFAGNGGHMLCCAAPRALLRSPVACASGSPLTLARCSQVRQGARGGGGVAGATGNGLRGLRARGAAPAPFWISRTQSETPNERNLRTLLNSRTVLKSLLNLKDLLASPPSRGSSPLMLFPFFSLDPSTRAALVVNLTGPIRMAQTAGRLAEASP